MEHYRGDGRGGDVVVEVSRVALSGGAQIRSGSGIDVGGTLSLVGTGQGGTVALIATDTVSFTGQNSGLSTRTMGQGHGGNITLLARQLQLADEAAISAESSGAGNAGNLTISTSEALLLSGNGMVTTAANQADGGNIQITAPVMVRLQDSAITATVGGGPGTIGGNISVDPEFVVLENSQIIANALENSQIIANAFEGRGGNIQIIAGVCLADPASRVSASSALGIAGTVDIRAPVTNLSGIVAPLPPEFAQVAALLRDQCVARLREGAVSSLVERGRDGLPATPEGVLPSRLYRESPAESNPPSKQAVSRRDRLRQHYPGRDPCHKDS